jgi:hypothetical protein
MVKIAHLALFVHLQSNIESDQTKSNQIKPNQTIIFFRAAPGLFLFAHKNTDSVRPALEDCQDRRKLRSIWKSPAIH